MNCSTCEYVGSCPYREEGSCGGRMAELERLAYPPAPVRKKHSIYSRTRNVINTDPQRRCYNGVNFSERVEHGEWELFGKYDTAEFAKAVVRGLVCDRYEYKIVEEE